MRVVYTGLTALVAVATALAHTDAVAAPPPPPAVKVVIPTTIPEVIPVGVPSDPEKRCPKWEPMFAEFGLPVETFSYICWRESRGNALAHNTRNRNGTQDYGLLQINSSWKTVTSNVCGTPKGQMDVLFDPRCNLAVARYLYDNGGLGHWSL